MNCCIGSQAEGAQLCESRRKKKVSNFHSPCSWCFIPRQFTMIQIQWEGNTNKWKDLSHQGERDQNSRTLRLHQFIGRELKRFSRKMNYREDLAKNSSRVCNWMCTWSNWDRYAVTMCKVKETFCVLSDGVTPRSDRLLRSIITESDGFPDNHRPQKGTHWWWNDLSLEKGLF